MNAKTIVLISVSLIVVLFLIGCSSSKGSYGGREQQIPPPPPKEKPEELPKPTPSEKVDTLNINLQNTQKPSYESKTVPQPTEETTPKAKFSVQIGAYTMAENAERIASLARERFIGKTVYTIEDKTDNLYKVMIGEFMTPEDARRFRDEMAQRYYTDYKDAWVSKIPQNK
ncbi:MAG: SPOR domain-containing protein [Ignavibacteriae bacterium]|nr:SPOR domain-containing protein [Ignavibacteriota bacterium]